MKRRWWAAAAVFVGLVGVAHGVSRSEIARRKRDLTTAIAAEHAALADRPRALVDAMDDVMLAAAADAWPGDLGRPSEDLFLAPSGRARSMVIVRAAVPEIARLDAIAGAVRRSEKDAFALCLARPPTSTAPDDVHAAATRYWLGGALFEDATHEMLPLRAVHEGLRPLSRAFLEELAEADDHLSLRRLEEEWQLRKPLSVALARTAADAELLVVVADELPPGAPPPTVGKGLTATRRPAILPGIEPFPHPVRVVVWSAAERRIVLRARGSVDGVTHPPPRRPRADVEMHGCQAALVATGKGLPRLATP